MISTACGMPSVSRSLHEPDTRENRGAVFKARGSTLLPHDENSLLVSGPITV